MAVESPSVVFPEDEDWGLGADHFTWILYRRQVRKSGRNIGSVIWKPEAFFPKLDQVFEHYLVQKQRNRGSVDTSFAELVEITKEVRESVEALGRQMDYSVRGLKKAMGHLKEGE